MAKNLLNKYVWLVETIYKAGRITFEEINEKWLDNDMSEGVGLALRTFHKWRIAAEENSLQDKPTTCVHYLSIEHRKKLNVRQNIVCLNCTYAQNLTSSRKYFRWVMMLR